MGLRFRGLDFGGSLARFFEGQQDCQTEEQQDPGSDVEGDVVGRGRQKSADGWADGDAGIVGRTHEGEGFQAFVRGQHIGHQSIGGDAVQADDQPSYSHQDGKMGQGGGLAEEVEGETVHQQAEDHDRFAPEAVGELPDKGRGDQAAHRREGDQAGDGGQGHVQGLADVDGEEGPHHAGADGADQHAEEEQPEHGGVFAEHAAGFIGDCHVLNAPTFSLYLPLREKKTSMESSPSAMVPYQMATGATLSLRKPPITGPMPWPSPMVRL